MIKLRSILYESLKGSEVGIKFNANFKKWFGGSKITKSGKPMVVFHGSKSSSVKSFKLSKAGTGTDTGMFGKGFYFTPSEKYASTYATSPLGLVALVLSIKNPLIIKSKSDIPEIKVADETMEDLLNGDKNYSIAFRKWLIANRYDGVIDSISSPSQIVALYPKQIKSIHNDGTWGVNSDKIYS